MTSPAITNVLGETRAVDLTYPDGSYVCPFCGYAVIPERDGSDCRNPACEAGIHADRDRALEMRRQSEERGAREAEDQRRHERLIEYARESEERRRAEVQEAAEAGYCVSCFVRSGNRKRVRHRIPDFHTRR